MRTAELPRKKATATNEQTPPRLPPTTVWIIDSDESCRIDQFVRRVPGATACHAPAAHRMLASADHGKPFYLAAMRGDEIVGVLPLIEQHDGEQGKLVSLPGAPDAGIVAVDTAARAALWDRACELARRRGLRLAGRAALPSR